MVAAASRAQEGGLQDYTEVARRLFATRVWSTRHQRSQQQVEIRHWAMGTSLSSLKQPHRHLDYPNHLDQFCAHLPSIKFIIILSYFNGKHFQIPQQRAGNHLVIN